MARLASATDVGTKLPGGLRAEARGPGVIIHTAQTQVSVKGLKRTTQQLHPVILHKAKYIEAKRDGRSWR